MFEKELKVIKIGYPTDTNYQNYGMRNIEKIMLNIPAALLLMFWAYFFFVGVFRLNQTL